MLELRDFSAGGESSYHDYLGYRMTEWRDGFVRLEMSVAGKHRNRGDYVHGGVLMGLLDIAGIHAGTHALGGKADIFTLSLATNFVAAARTDLLAAEGEIVRQGRSMYFSAARVLDGHTNAVYATAQACFSARPRKTG